jgi:hypothetical protein
MCWGRAFVSAVKELFPAVQMMPTGGVDMTRKILVHGLKRVYQQLEWVANLLQKTLWKISIQPIIYSNLAGITICKRSQAR